MDEIGRYDITIGREWCRAEVERRCVTVREADSDLFRTRWVVTGWTIHSAVATLDGRLITGMNFAKVAVWDFEDPRGVVATLPLSAVGSVTSLEILRGGIVVATTEREQREVWDVGSCTYLWGRRGDPFHQPER